MHAPGEPGQLIDETAPEPLVGTGDVLVAVHGAAYTPGELQWPSTWIDRSGHDRAPIIPCHEVSGVVAAVGFGASGLSVGDEVYGLTDWYRDGAAAERVAVEARNLAPRPRTIDHLAACTLPLAGLTAWQALFLHGRIDRGARVLVLGAGGGVGNLAAQIATGAGADVIGAGRARDREAIVAAGARFVDLEREWLPTLAGSTLVLDTVGGDPAAAAASRLGEAARMVSIVDPGVVEPLGARGAFFVVEPNRETLSEIASWADTGRLTPAPWRAWKLDDAAEAIAAKERRQVAGKVAIQLAEL